HRPHPLPSFPTRRSSDLNRRRGESADREDYDFYDITAWSLPFTFNLDAYWTEDATPLAGDVVTDTGPSPAPTPPATPPRAGSARSEEHTSELQSPDHPVC